MLTVGIDRIKESGAFTWGDGLSSLASLQVLLSVSPQTDLLLALKIVILMS